MKVGFIGLGRMGLPMTRNLLKKGFDVTVLSRSRGPVEQALAEGAKEAVNLKQMAAEMDIVCTCLPMPDTIETVYLGPDGLLEGAHDGLILVDHSTVSPTLNQKIAAAVAQKHAQFLDAPISGGPMGATAATLTIMVGGEKSAFERALPVFQAMGKTILHMGPTGSGSVVKLANQLLVGIHQAAMAEAFVLAAKSGADLSLVDQVVKNSTGQSHMIDRSLPFVLNRDFEQRFSIDLLTKDINLAIQLGETLEVPMTLAQMVKPMLEEVQAMGGGQEDVAALVKPYEKRAGAEVKK